MNSGTNEGACGLDKFRFFYPEVMLSGGGGADRVDLEKPKAYSSDPDAPSSTADLERICQP